jgi:predicted metalloprotease
MGIDHEVGHNVQWQLYDSGIQSLIPYPETILVEMQADCFAGMYANQALTSPAGIEGALKAMQIVSQQRIAAFELGYNTGDLPQCLALANEGTTPNDNTTTTDGGTTTNTPTDRNTSSGETPTGNGTVGG